MSQSHEEGERGINLMPELRSLPCLCPLHDGLCILHGSQAGHTCVLYTNALVCDFQSDRQHRTSGIAAFSAGPAD